MPSAFRWCCVLGGKSHTDLLARENHDELMTLGMFLSAVFMVQMVSTWQTGGSQIQDPTSACMLCRNSTCFASILMSISTAEDARKSSPARRGLYKLAFSAAEAGGRECETKGAVVGIRQEGDGRWRV